MANSERTLEGLRTYDAKEPGYHGLALVAVAQAVQELRDEIRASRAPAPASVAAPAAIAQAISDLVQYNYADEARDYKDNCSNDPEDNQRAGHIFESIVAVSRWMTAQLPMTPTELHELRRTGTDPS